MEGSHKLMLERRQGGTITGVRDVTSFDEKEIRLVTEEGKLSVRGEGLHVKQLDLQKGEVELQGRIDQLVYLNKKQTGKWKKAL
nr:sporulation protein YabP [uncultured Blautia sp.]